MRWFSVEEEAVTLPRGAFAQARRLQVRWQHRPITALNQGPFRSYLYPLYTPAGVPVTTEVPLDHPHHQSVWIGTDHFHCLLPYATDAYEEATYNFYINETFQGRAPGRIISVSVESTELATDHLRLVQTLEWHGPQEWGAPQGRTVAIETRTVDIRPGAAAHLIDVHSRLRPTEWDFRVGPTRHAYLGVRLAEGLRVIDGGRLLDAAGHRDSEAIRAHCADWVDGSGSVPSGQQAGVALFPYPSAAGHPWYAADYGSMTVNPFGRTATMVRRGGELEVAARLVVHDGDAADAGVAELFQAFQQTQHEQPG